MSSAIKSFLIITWAVLIVVFISWSYARYRGLSAPVKKPVDHAFLSGLDEFSLIAYPKAPPTGEVGAVEPLNAIEFLKEAAQLNRRIILWIDARPKGDGTLVLARDEREVDRAPDLEKVLLEFPHHKLIISVRGHRPGLITTFVSLIESTGTAERTLVQSQEDGFLAEIRKEKPNWIFGTSLAQTTQLIMLSSIGLESLSPIRGDVLIIDESRATRQLSARVFQEASRRGLHVFAGPVDSLEEARKLRSLGASAVLVSDRHLLIELLEK